LRELTCGNTAAEHRHRLKARHALHDRGSTKGLHDQDTVSAANSLDQPAIDETTLADPEIDRMKPTKLAIFALAAGELCRGGRREQQQKRARPQRASADSMIPVHRLLPRLGGAVKAGAWTGSSDGEPASPRSMEAKRERSGKQSK
jgi:hypothetical protein